MANRETGELALTIGGAVYTFALGLNALTQLEDLFSTPAREVTFQEVLDRVNAGSMKHIRALVWAALQKHHPEITIERAGALVDQAGGVFGFAEQLNAITARSMPDARDVEELGGSPTTRPPVAQVGPRGTGARSNSRLAKPA